MARLILLAPAAFKGTLGPRQVAEALAVGVRRAMPNASVLQCPISDGGDGLLDAVLPLGSLRERHGVRYRAAQARPARSAARYDARRGRAHLGGHGAGCKDGGGWSGWIGDGGRGNGGRARPRVDAIERRRRAAAGGWFYDRAVGGTDRLSLHDAQ